MEAIPVVRVYTAVFFVLSIELSIYLSDWTVAYRGVKDTILIRSVCSEKMEKSVEAPS